MPSYQLDLEMDAMKKQIAELTAPEPVTIVPVSKYPRISVGVTREELDEVSRLARRCHTSVSALGQLALRHLLIQSHDGALPMLPVSLTAAGAEPTLDELRAEIQERHDASQARINYLEAQIELDRLASL